jgi:mannose-1-phosphate guanylyltransferase
MKALLLAAGFGTRLKPITDSIPKCLVDINGRPLLEIWIELLVNAGIKDILINTHYLSEKVNYFIDASLYNEFVTVVHEKKLYGTGGTLLKNLSFFKDSPIILIHADNLSSFDMLDFIEHHNKRPFGTEITMMTFISDNPQSCGIVELNNQNIVINFFEKVKNPPSKLANGAVYIIEPSVMSFLVSLKKDEIDFSTDVLPFFIGKIYTYFNNVYHRDIGTLESYKTGINDFKNKNLKSLKKL